MASLRIHGNMYYARFRDPKSGKRVERSLGTSDQAVAKRLLREIEKREKRASVKRVAAETFQGYAVAWIDDRREMGVLNVEQDERWLRLHVYDDLGQLPLDIITASDLRDWATAKRKAGKLAPKSIHNCYGVIRSLFRAACVDGFVGQTPCILTEAELGPNVDRDPGWRPRAVWTREELNTLCYDERIGPVDRVANALAGFGGLRAGEVCGLRWADVERREPLSALIVCRSYDGPPKTKEARQVPIHPALGAILAEWRLSGWSSVASRNPQPEDYVIVGGPTRRGRPGRGRTKSMAYKAWLKAADAVELRTDAKRGEEGGKSYHDLRRTFISLARADGAPKDVLEHITHRGQGGRTIDLYTTMPWVQLCEAIAHLTIRREACAQTKLRD